MWDFKQAGTGAISCAALSDQESGKSIGFITLWQVKHRLPVARSTWLYLPACENTKEILEVFLI
jgi:hypothetical protein